MSLFSQLYEHAGGAGLVQCSPEGSFVAEMCKGGQLVVRDGDSLRIVRSFNCDKGVVRQLVWSPDGGYLLVALHGEAVVQAFSMDDGDWSARISEGLAGLVSACWSPDSRHILTTADFQLHTSVWSLTDKSQRRLERPKFPPRPTAFSSDGALLLFPQRIDCKDVLSLVSCDSWTSVRSWPLETMDVEDARWSPDDRFIALRDCPLTYRVLLLSPDGHQLAEYSAYSMALGARSLRFSPSSEFLAVSSYDGAVRLLNSLTWKPAACYEHTATVDGTHAALWREEAPKDAAAAAGSRRGARRAAAMDMAIEDDEEKENEVAARQPRLRRVRRTVTLPRKPDSTDDDVGARGVQLAVWSRNTRFLATRDDGAPRAVWIWDTSRLSLHGVLLFRRPARAIVWHSSRSCLAVATGVGNVCLWDVSLPDSRPVWLPVPAPAASKFRVLGLRWRPAGEQLLLLSTKHLLACDTEQLSSRLRGSDCGSKAAVVAGGEEERKEEAVAADAGVGDGGAGVVDPAALSVTVGDEDGGAISEERSALAALTDRKMLQAAAVGV